jgi:DNA-binding response OmpR family regulator
MHHLLVVDDEPVTSKLLHFLLTDEGYKVSTLSSGTDVLNALTTTAFSLILLDVMMPGMDGLEVCRQIRVTSQIPIIFLSALQEVAHRVAGLQSGGDDYITKPFEATEVLARVAAALRRTQQLVTTSADLKTPDLTLDVVDNQVRLARTGKVIDLTPIEARLLRCLLSNRGNVLTREMLMNNVWGYTYESDSNQLDVYMKRLRGKVEEHPNQPQLLLTIRGVGYKYQPQRSLTSPVGLNQRVA